MILLHARPTLIALDRASVRRVDVDGHLHVERANISKANVCPYYGREIPNWQALGLDGGKVYKLLRDPDELARAASTFAGKPLLDEHNPTVASDRHPHGQVVGSIGTDVVFDGTYLTAPLSVWDGDSIARIEDNSQRQLSPGYRYRADMTPGTYQGIAYDGKMCDIVGNHLALVREGRTGPDVVIGDGRLEMPKMLKSRMALMVNGAVAALVRPRMAADAQIDLEPAFTDVTAANLVEQREAIAGRVVEIAQDGLADGLTLDTADVLLAIDAVAATETDDDDAIPDARPTPAPRRRQTPAPVAGLDEAAVTSRIAEATAATRSATLAEAAAIRTAEREVAPVVGEIAAMNSAAGVYGFALDEMKVDRKGVPDAALGALFRAAYRPDAAPKPLALDHAAIQASRTGFAERFPTAGKLARS